MPAIEHMQALEKLQINTIIDVGANKGQFSVVARKLYPKAKIYAFEPLPDARRIYTLVVAEPVKLFPMALGAKSETANFFVASRADSSSLLNPSAKQEAAYGVNLASTSDVTVERLVDIMATTDLVAPVLLKIDVQGGELDVLRGAQSYLPLIDFLYVEASFVQLYDGQPLVDEVLKYLNQNKFQLRGIFNQSHTQAFGPTQVDLLAQAFP
jgi:FkbM family methyltransferase